MTTAACELYNRFGFYTVPLTAAMTTMRYCQFEDLQNINNTNGQSEYNGGDQDASRDVSRDVSQDTSRDISQDASRDISQDASRDISGDAN